MKCIVTFVFCVLILTSCSSSNTQSISDGTNTTGETTVKQEKVGFSCSGEDCGFKNNSIADFMKKLPYDKKVGKLDGKYVFIDPEMGRYQWALTFENSPKAMTGSESINGVTVVFDRDFKILSQSGLVYSTGIGGSNTGNLRDDISNYTNIIKIIDTCTPGFTSIQKCVEDTQLTAAPSTSFPEFYKSGNYDVILTGILTKEAKKAKIDFLTKTKTELENRMKKTLEGSSSFEQPDYVGKSILDLMK